MPPRNPPLLRRAPPLIADSNGSAMLERTDLEPVFFAPFVSSVMQVEPGWIDYNGHLNMAYYNVLFDRAVDEATSSLGLRARLSAKTRNHSTFTAEAHIALPARVACRRPGAGDLSAARFRRKAHALFRAAFSRRGRLDFGHVREHGAARRHDAPRRSRRFPTDVAARLALMKAAHARLPLPDGAGRRMACRRKASDRGVREAAIRCANAHVTAL